MMKHQPNTQISIKPNNENDIEDRKVRWRMICNDYAKAFANKHGYDIDYELEHGYLWVRNNPGTVAEICDMFVGMEEIIYDMDTEQPIDNFEKWYWKNLEIYELTGRNYMNYESFCKGCNDPYSDEKMEQIRASKQKVENTKIELDELINNITKTSK